MKTLILNGSPRKNGDTAQLLELAKAQLQGTYHVVSAYTADIHPCIDCGHCQKQFGCIFADEMETVYTYLKDCDRILLASPIYFSELTGCSLPSKTQKSDTQNTKNRSDLSDLRKPERFFLCNIIF